MPILHFVWQCSAESLARLSEPSRRVHFFPRQRLHPSNFTFSRLARVAITRSKESQSARCSPVQAQYNLRDKRILLQSLCEIRIRRCNVTQINADARSCRIVLPKLLNDGHGYKLDSRLVVEASEIVGYCTRLPTD